MDVNLMQISPVLILTRNATLWQQWRKIDGARWMVARSQSLQDLERRRTQGQPMVVLDAALPDLPAWSDPLWNALLRGLNVLVLSIHPSQEVARQVLACGARGYAHAYMPPSALNDILLGIKNGQIWLGRPLQQRLLRDVNEYLTGHGDDAWSIPLTPREQDVAYRTATGESVADIAQHLGSDVATVRQHLSDIFEKLQVGDRLSLALKIQGIHL